MLKFPEQNCAKIKCKMKNAVQHYANKLLSELPWGARCTAAGIRQGEGGQATKPVKMGEGG